MQYTQLKSVFQKELSHIYNIAEIHSMFFRVIEHFCNVSQSDFLLYPERSIAPQSLPEIQTVITQLKRHMPLQYILGIGHFYGNDFFVNEHTLIPRQETEELVDWILQDADKQQPLKILDIGTGSGCIAISLALNLKNASVYAMDISPEALAISQKNAKNKNVNIHFICTDILKVQQLDHFDIIVSNPPYVRECEKHEIKANVLHFEPHSALFVEDDNPLIFYKKISDLAYNALSSSGSLYFEINEYLPEQTQEVVKASGFKHINIKTDINKKARMIRAKK